MSTETEERSAGDIVGSIIGLVISGLIALAASFMGLMLVMGSDSCGASSTCDDDVIAFGVLFGVAVPLICWVTALILVIVRQARSKRSWWLPLVAGVACLVAEFVAFLIVDAGVTPIG